MRRQRRQLRAARPRRGCSVRGSVCSATTSTRGSAQRCGPRGFAQVAGAGRRRPALTTSMPSLSARSKPARSTVRWWGCIAWTLSCACSISRCNASTRSRAASRSDCAITGLPASSCAMPAWSGKKRPSCVGVVPAQDRPYQCLRFPLCLGGVTFSRTPLPRRPRTGVPASRGRSPRGWRCRADRGTGSPLEQPRLVEPHPRASSRRRRPSGPPSCRTVGRSGASAGGTITQQAAQLDVLRLVRVAVERVLQGDAERLITSPNRSNDAEDQLRSDGDVRHLLPLVPRAARSLRKSCLQRRTDEVDAQRRRVSFSGASSAASA